MIYDEESKQHVEYSLNLQYKEEIILINQGPNTRELNENDPLILEVDNI